MFYVGLDVFCKDTYCLSSIRTQTKQEKILYLKNKLRFTKRNKKNNNMLNGSWFLSYCY